MGTIILAILQGLVITYVVTLKDDDLCKGTQYDRESEKCCDGVVQDKPYGTPKCCGTVAYNANNYACCHGQVTPRPASDNVGCCGTVGYDKDTELCCRESAFVFSKVGREQPGCCGGQILDRAKEICCENVAVVKPDGNDIGCCKYEPYNRVTHTCVNGIVVSLDPECFGACYNIETEICCNGAIYPKTHRMLECCGNQTFSDYWVDNPGYIKCCDGDVFIGPPYEWRECCHIHVSPNEGYPWCCPGSGHIYQDGKCCEDNQPAIYLLDVCCGGRKFELQHYMPHDDWQTIYCCGEGIYGPERWLCCSGQQYMLSEEHQKCCGEVAYSLATQLCCGTTLHDVPPTLIIKDCCGENPFDPNVQICCDGRIYWKGYSNDKNYTCCDGRLHETKEGWKCCGTDYAENGYGCCDGTPYAMDDFVCCNNTVQAWKGPSTSCCGVHSFDADGHNQFCCGSTLFDMLDSFACCGDRVYYTMQEMCCEGVVNPLKDSCCGYRSVFDDGEICCDGNVFADPEGNLQCCDRSPFNPDEKICCQDWTTNSPYGWLQAISYTHLYDSSLFICCKVEMNGRLIHQQVNRRFQNNTECCATMGYNANIATCTDTWLGNYYQVLLGECDHYNNPEMYDYETEECCGGKIYTHHEYKRCCGKIQYDIRSEQCCKDIVYDTGIGIRCCGELAYDESREICCMGKRVHAKTSEIMECCGPDLAYDPSSEICCTNKYNRSEFNVVSKKSDSAVCCGMHATYKPDTELCCNKRAVHLSGPSVLCCGDDVRNSADDLCCNGVVHPGKYLEGYSCCRADIFMYNDGIDLCCSGVLFPGKKSDGFECCGNVAYNLNTEKCCRDRGPPLIAKEGFDCCRFGYMSTYNRIGQVQVFNTEIEVCCYGRILNKHDANGNTLGCCHQDDTHIEYFYENKPPMTVVYNSATQGCCGAIPYNLDTETCCAAQNFNPHVFYDPEHKLECCFTYENVVQTFDPTTHQCINGLGVVSNAILII